MPPTGDSGPDYYAQINKLVVADTGSPVEMAARYLAVCLGTLTFVVLTGIVGLLFWLAIYLTINLTYLFILLRITKPATRWHLRLAEVLNILSALAFSTVMPLLWVSGDTPERAAAVCLLVAQMIFNVGRHGANRTILAWDALSMSAIALYFAYDLTRSNDELLVRIAVGVATLAVAAYYATVLRENFTQNQKRESDVARMVQANRREAVGQLTAGIAHDFNNILTAVLGHLELARATDDSRDQRASMAAAHQAASRAARLTGQLLAFSHQAPQAVVRCDLAMLMAGIVAMAEGVLPRRITLWADLADDVPSVLVDKTQCETAVFNILTNARDATAGPGDIHLSLNQTVIGRPRRLTWGSMLSPGTYAVVMVEDRGSGMDHDLLQRAPEPFFSGKGLGQGSGLGLAMVKGFAEQSGGGLAMTSSLGVGTVVSLYLPIPQVSLP